MEMREQKVTPPSVLREMGEWHAVGSPQLGFHPLSYDNKVGSRLIIS